MARRSKAEKATNGRKERRNQFPILCCYCEEKQEPGQAVIWTWKGKTYGRCENCIDNPAQVKGRKKMEQRDTNRKAKAKSGTTTEELNVNKLNKKQLQDLVARLVENGAGE